MSCAAPLDLGALLGYWMGELAPEDETPLEEHLLGCGYCTARLEWIAALGPEIRDAVRAGRLHAAISVPFLEAMKAAGLRLREYRVAPGGSVDCTLTAQDDGVVSRLKAPLEGVTRLDAVHRFGEGLEARIEDLPFDPDAGEVLLIPAAAAIRTMPAHTWRVRLFAVEAAGERVLGDYTFHHTPG